MSDKETEREREREQQVVGAAGLLLTSPPFPSFLLNLSVFSP